MTQLKWKTLNLKRMDILLYTGILFVLLALMLILFMPSREVNLMTAYLAPAVVAMVIYMTMRLGLPRSAITLLPPAFALWFLLSRIINGDHYLHESHPYVYMTLFACCVLFFVPFLASGERRDKVLRAVALVYSLPMSIIAWIAVIAALTGTPWVNPLNSNSILGINSVYANPYRLNILNIHPNFSAVLCYTALALLFFLLFRTKRLWLRIGYGILCAGLCLAVFLTGSISAIIVMGLMIGVVVFAVFVNRKGTTRKRMWITLLVILLIAAVVVVSYPLTIQWTKGFYDKARQETATATPDPETTETKDEVFAQERLNVLTMIGNMRARFTMYSSAFLSIADRPVTLLIGELHQAAMDRSARMINYPFQNHLHNSFLQTLVVGGGISFLIVLLFSVLIIIRGIRLFFNKNVPLYLKMLVLAPAGLLCHSMTEVLLFIDTRLPNMLFFFLAGMIVVYTEELCSGKAKQEEAKTPAVDSAA